MILKYEFGGNEYEPGDDFEFEITEEQAKITLVKIMVNSIIRKSKIELTDKEEKIIKETVEFMLEDLDYRDIDDAKEPLDIYKDELLDYYQLEAGAMYHDALLEEKEKKYL